MAVKDLNDLRYDKITGDKLYAIEWNTIVKSLQEHVKTANIHLPITINKEDNTLSYKEGNNIYTYALNRKTGESWGPLLINYVKRGDSPITEDNNHYYNIENIPATSAENIIELLVSFKQQKYIDSVPQEGIFQYPANTVTLKSKSDMQGFSISISDTDNDNVKKLTITVPDNSSYTEIKEYNFEIEGSIGEGANDKKLVQFKLTQNAIGETWGAITINNITLDSGDNPDEIPSRGLIDVKIILDFQQVHNGVSESILSSDIQELTYVDYGGNPHTLTESNQFTISIPKNLDYNSSYKKDMSITISSIKSHDYILEDLTITLLLNKVNEISRKYGDNKTINWSGYNNLGYAANSYVDPKSFTFNIPILIDYDNGDTDITGTPITSGGLKSYSFTPASGITGVSIVQNSGRISRNIANDSLSELPLGSATLTIAVDAIPDVSTSVLKEVNVYQDEAPSAYYRFVNTSVTPNVYTDLIPLSIGENTITITSENNNKDIVFHSPNTQFSNYQKYYSDGSNNYPIVLNPGTLFAAYYGLSHNYVDDDTTINNVTFYGCAAANVRTGDIIKVKIV